MWSCPICSGEKKKEYKCISCGFDEREDFVRCRTICAVGEEDVKSRVKYTNAAGILTETAENNALLSAINSQKDMMFYCALVKYTGNEEIVVIPEGVQEIASLAFYANENIRKVIMPKSVKKIGESSFAECSNLQEIVFSEGLEEIGDKAFINCKSLTNVKLPDTLKKSGELVFGGCERLNKKEETDKKIVNGWMLNKDNVLLVESIASNLIRNETTEQREKRKKEWNKAVKLVLCEGITEITMEYFQNMKNLEEVDFPSTLKKIGYGSFKECEKLKKIKLPDGVTNISAHAFDGCRNLTEVQIPASVKYIGDDAFWRCNKLGTTYVEKDCAICTGNFGIRHK